MTLEELCRRYDLRGMLFLQLAQNGKSALKARIKSAVYINDALWLDLNHRRVEYRDRGNTRRLKQGKVRLKAAEWKVLTSDAQLTRLISERNDALISLYGKSFSARSVFKGRK